MILAKRPRSDAPKRRTQSSHSLGKVKHRWIRPKYSLIWPCLPRQWRPLDGNAIHTGLFLWEKVAGFKVYPVFGHFPHAKSLRDVLQTFFRYILNPNDVIIELKFCFVHYFLAVTGKGFNHLKDQVIVEGVYYTLQTQNIRYVALFLPPTVYGEPFLETANDGRLILWYSDDLQSLPRLVHLLLQVSRKRPWSCQTMETCSTVTGLEPAIPRSEVWCLIH